MNRKKSVLWSYFQPTTDQKATCNMCRQMVSYKTSISNLKRHLQRKHPLIKIASESKTSSNESKNDSGNLALNNNDKIHEDNSVSQPSNNTAQSTNSIEHKPSTTTSIAGSSKSVLQSKLHFLPKKIGLQQKNKLDRSLMGLFTKDFQPFTVLEDEGFRNFIKSLNPSYELPNRKTITQSRLPALYEETLKNVQMKMTTVKSVTLTTDCWTSLTTESYMAITVHFLSEDFHAKSILLDCVSMPQAHTSENLAQELKKIVDSWGLESKILLAISDNASNIKKALNDLLKWKHFGCYAHTLNLIVEDSLSVVDELLKKIRKLVSHFKRSSTATAKLAEVQNQQGKIPKKLLQDVTTRWNSTFYMLDRILEIEEAVRTTMALLNTDSLSIVSVEEWQLLAELKTVLEPMERLTKIMSGQHYTTLSSVIVLTKGLEDNYNNINKNKEKFCTFAVTQAVVQKILWGIQKRLGDLENSKTLLISTFLDPRFKNIGFSNDEIADKAKKLVINLVSEVINNETKRTERKENTTDTDENRNTDVHQPEKKSKIEFSLWSNFDKKAATFKPSGTSASRAIIEVQRYVQDDQLDRHDDPLSWWRQRSYNYPYLSKVCIEKFGTVSTSVPCERLFSKTGQLISERRSRLTPQKVRQIMFLNINQRE